MRKILLFLMLFVSVGVSAQQKFYAYCYIQYQEDGSVFFTSSNTTRMLADKDNTKVKVHNIIGAINFLAKYGFEYVDMFYPRTTRIDRAISRDITYREQDGILMRKLVTAEHELTNGLHFVVNKEETKIRSVELPQLK